MSVACHFCGKEMRPYEKTARLVTGWVVDRQAGGANHVRQRKSTGTIAHPSCLNASDPNNNQTSFSFEEQLEL